MVFLASRMDGCPIREAEKQRKKGICFSFGNKSSESSIRKGHDNIDP